MGYLYLNEDTFHEIWSWLNDCFFAGVKKTGNFDAFFGTLSSLTIRPIWLIFCICNIQTLVKKQCEQIFDIRHKFWDMNFYFFFFFFEGHFWGLNPRNFILKQKFKILLALILAMVTSFLMMSLNLKSIHKWLRTMYRKEENLRNEINANKGF